MAKINADRLKQTLISSRDRVIILLLIVAICVVFYRLTEIIAGGVERVLDEQLPETGPVGVSMQSEVMPDPIVNNITEGQPITEWKPIMPPKDPFTSQEKKRRILQNIRSEYQRGLRAMNEEDYEQAIVHFRNCLEMDRFQAAEEIYDEGLPGNLIRRAEDRNIKNFFVESRDQARQLTEQAESSEAGGQLEQALDFYNNVVQIARDALERERVDVVEQEIVDDMEEILAESQEKVAQLEKIVFHDIISRLHETAQDNYEEFNNFSAAEQRTPDVLHLLVEVRQDLEEASQRITEAPEELADRVPQSERAEIDSFLQQVREDVEDRIPTLVQHVEDLTQQGQEDQDLDTLNEALAIVDILDTLQPGAEMTQLRERVQGVKDEVEVQVAEKDIQELLSRVRQQLQTINAEMQKSPADWNAIESIKEDGYTALNEANRIRARFPTELASMLNAIQDLRDELDSIVILPPVPNAVYVDNIRSKVFIVLVEGSREPLTEDRPCNPYPVGRGDQFCLTEVSDDNKTIWVEVPGKYRETELQCQECDD